MKKHVLLFTLCFLLCIGIFSQTPGQKQFHAAAEITPIEKIIKLPNGSLTILSLNHLFSMDVNGTILWSKEIYPQQNKIFFTGYSFVCNTDGSYVLVGVFNQSPRVYGITLVKTNAAGDVVWGKLFLNNSFSRVSDIIKTNDGGFALIGSTDIIGKRVDDTFVMKLDSNAGIQWSRVIGSNNTGGSSIIQTKDNGYAITGSASTGNTTDMFVAKLDNGGNLLWSKYFGDDGSDSGSKIIETIDGGLIALGSHGILDDYSPDYFLVKLRTDGSLQWAKYYGGNDVDYESEIIQAADGNYVVTGTSYSFRELGSDIYSIKTSASGNVLSSKAVAGSPYTIISLNNGFAIGGFDSTYSGDGLLVNTDNNLNTCNSRDVITDVHISTRSVNANFHQKNMIFTAKPLSYLSKNYKISVKQLCSSKIAENTKSKVRTDDLKVSVFPNPVKDKLTLQFNGIQSSDMQLRVIDQQGNIFISRNVSVHAGLNTTIINAENLRNGNYFLALTWEDGSKKIIPFIKE